MNKIAIVAVFSHLGSVKKVTRKLVFSSLQDQVSFLFTNSPFTTSAVEKYLQSVFAKTLSAKINRKIMIRVFLTITPLLPLLWDPYSCKNKGRLKHLQQVF
jgi:hypothetical protein|tara:strand:- start:167 stop:469 length:303 start_codon:yes stop_codon:yes gene_type:complete